MLVELNMYTLREYNTPLDSAINARCQWRQKLQGFLQSHSKPIGVNKNKLAWKQASKGAQW